MLADLHIHSCLSPCADITMTPHGILRNFKYKIMSITDHNHCGNSRVFEKICEKQNVIFLPGIEITSMEEVHILGYFENISDLEKVSRVVYDHLPNVKNDPELFGYQLLINEKDEFTGMIEKNLSLATDMRFEEIIELIEKNDGIAVPAHVDRKFGVLYQLGFIPDLNLKVIEVFRKENVERFRKEGYTILCSSDAHNIDGLGTRYSVFLERIERRSDVLKSIVDGKVRTFWDDIIL